MQVPSYGYWFWLLVGSVAGQTWTRFRGPNGSGESDAAAIPAAWTLQDALWRVKLPGTGHSSPVLWGDRVYVTATIEEDATQIVCCLNAADGGNVWQRSFPSKPYHKNGYNSFAASTPAVDQDRVYVTWTTPDEYTLVALQASTGRGSVAPQLRALRGPARLGGVAHPVRGPGGGAQRAGRAQLA